MRRKWSQGRGCVGAGTGPCLATFFSHRLSSHLRTPFRPSVGTLRSTISAPSVLVALSMQHEHRLHPAHHVYCLHACRIIHMLRGGKNDKMSYWLYCQQHAIDRNHCVPPEIVMKYYLTHSQMCPCWGRQPGKHGINSIKSTHRTSSGGAGWLFFPLPILCLACYKCLFTYI